MTSGILEEISWPDDWPAIPFRRLADRRKDIGRPSLPPLSVFLDEGVVPRSSREDNYNRLGADLSQYLVVEPGDLVFNKLRAWQGGIGVSGHLGIVSPAYFVCRPRQGLLPRFAHYALRSSPYLQELTRVSKWMPPAQFDIAWEDLRDVVVRVPPFEAQRAIADYLDVETARIDALVVAYRRQLDLLALRKRATASDELMTHSIARVPIRRLVTTVTSGPRGWSSLEVEHSNQLFLRIANVPTDSIDLKLEEVAFINAPGGDEAARCRARPGDVLTTITAAIGQVAVVPADLGEAYVSQHLALLRPNLALVMPKWLALALWSGDAQRQLDAARYGGTKQQLSLDDVRDVRVPLADLTVQNVVLPRLLAQLESLTVAERRIRRVIDLLTERRQALIASAVTGRLDIPGVAA